MKLFVRGYIACAALAVGMVFTGCGSPSESQLDKARSHPTAESPAQVARFQVGDVVIVSFSGAPTTILDHSESIKEDGTINLDFIGKVYAVGKTAGQLQSEIYTNYVPKYYVRLTVTVKSGDRLFYVGGEVNSHGTRAQYTDGLTVTKAIQSAGGLTDFANHSKVWLVRSGSGQRIRVDYDEALKNPARDPMVYPDDQINVEKKLF